MEEFQEICTKTQDSPPCHLPFLTHAEYIEISNSIDGGRRAQIKEAFDRDGYTAVVDGVPSTAPMAELGQSSEALQVFSKARLALVDYKESQMPCSKVSFSMIDMAGDDWVIS